MSSLVEHNWNLVSTFHLVCCEMMLWLKSAQSPAFLRHVDGNGDFLDTRKCLRDTQGSQNTLKTVKIRMHDKFNKPQLMSLLLLLFLNIPIECECHDRTRSNASQKEGVWCEPCPPLVILPSKGRLPIWEQNSG